MNVIDEYDGNEEAVAHHSYPTRDEGFKLHAFDSAVSNWGRSHNLRPPASQPSAGPPLPSLTIEERRALLNSLKYEDRNHTFTSRLANIPQRPGPTRPHTSQATVSFTPVVLDESASVKAIAVSMQRPAQTHSPIESSLSMTANGSYRISSSALDPSLPRFMQPTTSFLHSSPHASPAHRPASAQTPARTHDLPHTGTPSRHLPAHSSPSPALLSRTAHQRTPVRRASLSTAEHTHAARTTPTSPPRPPRVATPLRFGSPVQISGIPTHTTAHMAPPDVTTRPHASCSHSGAPASFQSLAQSRSGFLAPAVLLAPPHTHAHAAERERVPAPVSAAARPPSTTTATSKHSPNNSVRSLSAAAPVSGSTSSTARDNHARDHLDTTMARPPVHGLSAGKDTRVDKTQSYATHSARDTSGRSAASALTRSKPAARGTSSARTSAPMPASKAEATPSAPSRTFLAPTAASTAKALSPPPAAGPLSPASQWRLTSERAEREREEWVQQRVVPRARMLGELPQPQPVQGGSDVGIRSYGWGHDDEAAARASAGQSVNHTAQAPAPAYAHIPASVSTAPLRMSALSGRSDVVVPSLQVVPIGNTDARGATLMDKPSLQGRDYADIAALLPSHVPPQSARMVHAGNASFSGSSAPVRYSSFTDAPIYAVPRSARHPSSAANSVMHTSVDRSSVPQPSQPAATASRPLLDTSQAPGPRHVTAEDIRELVSLVGAAAAVKIVGVATVRAVVGEGHVDALCATPTHPIAGDNAGHTSGGGGGCGGRDVPSTVPQRALGSAASSFADGADINGVFPPAVMAGGTADDAARLQAILTAARAAALRGDSAGAATAHCNAPHVHARGREGGQPEVPSVSSSPLIGDASFVERNLGALWYPDEAEEDEALRSWRGETTQHTRTGRVSPSAAAHAHPLAAASPPRTHNTPAVANLVSVASPLAKCEGNPTMSTTATTPAPAAVVEAARQKQEEWVRKRAMLRERLQQRHTQEVAAAAQDKYTELNTALGSAPARSGGPTAVRRGKRAPSAVRQGSESADGKRSRAAGSGTYPASASQSSRDVPTTSSTSSAAVFISLNADDLKGLDTTIDGALARTAALEGRALRRASTAAKGSDVQRRSGAPARASRWPASAVRRGRNASTLAQTGGITSAHAPRQKRATQTSGISPSSASTHAPRLSPSEPATMQSLPGPAATVTVDNAGDAEEVVEVSLRVYGESLHSEEDFYAREDASIAQRITTMATTAISGSTAAPEPHHPISASGPAHTQAVASPAAATAPRKSTLTTPQPPRRHPDGSLVLPSPGLPLAARVGAAGVERLLRNISAQVQRELGPAMASVDTLEHSLVASVAASAPQSAQAMQSACASVEDRLDASIADCRDVSEASLGPLPSAWSVAAVETTSAVPVMPSHTHIAAENQSESEAAVLAQLTRHHMQDKSVGHSARARMALALLERARVKQAPAARAPSDATVNKANVPRSSVRSSPRQRPGTSLGAIAKDSQTAAAGVSQRNSARTGSRSSARATAGVPAAAPVRIVAGKGSKRAAGGKALRTREPFALAPRPYDANAQQRADAIDTLDTTANAPVNQSVSWFIGLEPASPTQPRKVRRFVPQLTPKRPAATLGTNRCGLEGNTDPAAAATTGTSHGSSVLPDLPLPQALSLGRSAASARAVDEQTSSAHAVALHRKRAPERDIPVEIFLPRSKPPRGVAGEDTAEMRCSVTVATSAGATLSAEAGRQDFWETQANHDANTYCDAPAVESSAPAQELDSAPMCTNKAEDEGKGNVASHNHAFFPPAALSCIEHPTGANTQHSPGNDAAAVRRGGRKEEHVSWAVVEAEVAVQPALSDASTASSHGSTELSCGGADMPVSIDESSSDAAPVASPDSPTPAPAPIVADVSYLLQLLSTSAHAGDVSITDIIDALARSRVPVATLPAVTTNASADIHDARGAATAPALTPNATTAMLSKPAPVDPLVPATATTDAQDMHVPGSVPSSFLTPAAGTTDALAAVAATDTCAPHHSMVRAATSQLDTTLTAGVPSPELHALPAVHASAIDAAVADSPALHGTAHLDAASVIPSEQGIHDLALPHAHTHAQLPIPRSAAPSARGALSGRRASVTSSGGLIAAPLRPTAAAVRRSSLGPEATSVRVPGLRLAPQRAATGAPHASRATPHLGGAMTQRSHVSRPLVASEASSPPLARTGEGNPASGHTTQAPALRTKSARASSAPAATRATTVEDTDEYGLGAGTGQRVAAHASAQAPVRVAAHTRGRAASPGAAVRGRPLSSHLSASFAAGPSSAPPLTHARHNADSSPTPNSTRDGYMHAVSVPDEISSSADSPPLLAEMSRWVHALLTDMQHTIAHYSTGARLSPIQLQAATGLAPRDVRVSTLLRQYALMQAAHTECSSAREEEIQTRTDNAWDAPVLQSPSLRPAIAPSLAASSAAANASTRAHMPLPHEAPHTQATPPVAIADGEGPSTRTLIDSLLQGVAALRRAEQGEDVDLDTTSRAVRKALGKDTSDFLYSFGESDISRAVDVDVSARIPSALPSEHVDGSMDARAAMSYATTASSTSQAAHHTSAIAADASVGTSAGTHTGNCFASAPAPDLSSAQNPLTTPMRAPHYPARHSPASPRLPYATAQRCSLRASVAQSLDVLSVPALGLGLGSSVALTESERVALLREHSDAAELLPWVFATGKRA